MDELQTQIAGEGQAQEIKINAPGSVVPEADNPFAGIEIPKLNDPTEFSIGETEKSPEASARIEVADPIQIPEVSTEAVSADESKTPIATSDSKIGAYVPEVGEISEDTITSGVRDFELPEELPSVSTGFAAPSESKTSPVATYESKTPVVESTESPEKAASSGEIFGDLEDIKQEVDNGFAEMEAKLESYLESIDQAKATARENIRIKEDALKQRTAEIKSEIAAKQDDLRAETDETSREIKAIRADISDLERKREMAEAQKKRVLMVQNPSEIAH